MIAGSGARAAQAYELRQSGMSYAAIGRALGDASDPSVPIYGTRAKQLVQKRERYLQLVSAEFGPLRVAVRNALANHGITSVAELCRCTAKELLAIRNFGRTSLAEVERFLADLGIGLYVSRLNGDEWAACSDRLPGDGGRVLVYSPLFRHEIGEWAGHKFGWRDRFGNPLEGVTHWRSLPEPPA